MRLIHTHQTNACNRGIELEVDDDRSEYRASWEALRGEQGIELPFQFGEMADVGNTGVTIEVLLAIVIDKLEGFQAGPWACPDNDTALDYARRCLDTLVHRTREREERGVEGKHQL